MKKYSRQVKDRLSDQLKDEKVKFLDIVLENYMVDMLLGDNRRWPIKWMKMTFNPSDDLSHTVMLLKEIFPKEKWELKCEEPGLIYTAWVSAEENSVFAHTEARALCLAIWNCWRLQNDSPDE
jgi:hypothetical protein